MRTIMAIVGGLAVYVLVRAFTSSFGMAPGFDAIDELGILIPAGLAALMVAAAYHADLT